jgi:hypothetical protein
MTPSFALQAQPSLVNQFSDIDQPLVFNYTLQPNQVITGLQQPVSRDGDFYMCALNMSSVNMQRPDLIQLAANAGVRISDDTGYKLMSDYIQVGLIGPAFGNSYPKGLNMTHLFKAGTKINIDLQELSGVTNIVQLIFYGRYRYRASDVQTQGRLLANAKKFARGE